MLPPAWGVAKPSPWAARAVSGTLFAEDAKVGLGLRPVVEAEDGYDIALKLGWKIDAALADPVGYAVEGLVA